MTFHIATPNTYEFSSPFGPLGMFADRPEMVWDSEVTPIMIKQAYLAFVHSLQVRVSPRDPDTLLIWNPATVPADFLEQNGLVEVAG